LKGSGIREVAFESGAGGGAQFDDDAYSVTGASVVANRALAWDSDIVLAVRPPDSEAIKMNPEGSTYTGHVQPAFQRPLVEALLEQKVKTLAMDCIPRQLSRAQAYDTLSSTANIAG
jgi:H+-translocating NAD(P) transhydrogenase subunit alpha